MRHALLCPAVLGLLAACSPPPPPATTRVLDHVEAGTARQAPGLPPRRVLLTGADPAFQPRSSLRKAPDPAAQAALLASASRAADGALQLGSTPGSWLGIVPVAGGETVRLRCRIDATGLVPADAPPEQGGARAVLAELSAVPTDLAQAAALVLVEHPGDVLRGEHEGTPVSLTATLGADTRALAVVLGAHSEAPARDARAAFRGVELVVAGARDLLAEEVGHDGPIEDPFAPVVARFSLGLCERPGVAVLPGGEVRIPATTPASPCRLELFAGLVPLAGGAGPAAASLRVEARSPSAGPDPVVLVEADLVATTGPSSRWRELTLPVPTSLLGRSDIELRISCDGAWANFAPVVAGLRLVPDRPARPGPNLVLISLDTLRADRVGAYGCPRDTTPHLDALADDALLFEDVWANGPYTLPSHMSLFSGQLASVHGVREPGYAPNPGRTRFLAELLAERGYATAAFTGGAYVLPEFGFGRGFDRYSSVDPTTDVTTPRFAALRGAIPGLDEALVEASGPAAIGRWLERHRDEPFFVFVHTYAAHELDPRPRHLEALGLEPRALGDDLVSQTLLGPPWDWPDPVPEGAFERLLELYDGGVRQADELVGAVLAQLRRLELWDDTVIVVTSDHGKELGDHGGVGHGHTLYEELLSIPLVIRLPGVAPDRVTEPAQLVDVLPTVLQALDVPVPGGVQGRSLLLDPQGERPLFAEVEHLAVKYALREGDQKRIWGPLDTTAMFPNEVELERFDLGADPGEQRPGAATASDVDDVRAFRDALRALGASLGGAGGTETGLSPEARAYLQALGYTQGLDG